MDLILSLNRELALFMGHYISDISLALVATCLVVYGDQLNKVIKRLVHHWHFLARVLAFIFMCTFGYGLLTVWLQPWLETGLRHIPGLYLPSFVIAIFCFLGVMAERKRHL